MATGLAGCDGSGDASTGAAVADTQATEAQKEEAKNDVKKEDEKEGPETSDDEGASDFHIGIITGSVSQPEDNRHGAKAFQATYGGDMVKLAIYPDNLTEELKTTIQAIVNFSDDPKMRATTMDQSIPSTTEALREIRETRPDIPCTADEGHEDLPEIGNTADLVCNDNFVVRGYLIIRTAHEPGCDAFTRISFPYHIAYETMGRRVAVMKKACKEFGMEFVPETAPDPISNVDVTGTQAYMPERVPEWVKKHGKNVAYSCTNDAHTELLLKQLMEHGGYFIETDLPSPLTGYPGTLGTDLTTEVDGLDRILARVESTIVERGGADHFGTRAYSHGYTASAGLAQRALNALNDESELDDIDDIARTYQVFSPKAEWSGPNYTNAETGVKLGNAFLVHQDTYTMGDSGHSTSPTKIEVPEKYFTTK